MATDATIKQEKANEVSGTVVEQGSKAGYARLPSALDKFFLDAKAESGDVEIDPMDRIIQQVLNAESAAAVLTPTDVLQGRDLIEEPMMLMGFDLTESEFDAGSPFYANMDVMRPDGTQAVVNCGHKKVLAQLVKLRQFDEFPYRVKFITRGTSKQGTPMLELASWQESDYVQEVPF